MPEPGVASIATADDAGHARHRKLLAHAFSEGALREQEPILQSYINLFIRKLGNDATNQGKVVDLVEWYKFIAFDIVADLTFGESFHNLDRAENHPWVKAVEADMGMAVRLSQTYAVPGLSAVVGWLLPWVLGLNHHLAYQYSAVKTRERLERGQERPDFMTHILRHNDEKGLSREEIDADVSTLINAGSETTSTVLAGCTYYLLRPENGDALQKLVDEVRTTFKDAKTITQEAVRKLDWTNAVVWEALRLYPPLPIALPRLVPDGGKMVAGCWVPGGVGVLNCVRKIEIVLTSVRQLLGYPSEWPTSRQNISQSHCASGLSDGSRNAKGIPSSAMMCGMWCSLSMLVQGTVWADSKCLFTPAGRSRLHSCKPYFCLLIFFQPRTCRVKTGAGDDYLAL